MAATQDKRIFVAIGWVASGIFIFLLSLLLSIEFFAKLLEVDVSQETPKEFPVVVVTAEGPEIILMNSFGLEDGVEGSFSFVPADVPGINEQLRRRQKERRAKGVPKINVEQISEDTQLVELEIHGEGIFRSSYEAKDRSIKPRSLTIAGPLFALYPGAVACLAMLGFVGCAIWIKRRSRFR